jgi:hypothetical protein
VGDVKFLSAKENIYLNTTEALIESVEEGSLVSVVVVGVSAKQGVRGAG